MMIIGDIGLTEMRLFCEAFQAAESCERCQRALGIKVCPISSATPEYWDPEPLEAPLPPGAQDILDELLYGGVPDLNQ